MPGERHYQLEVFWSWKKILHYIEQHGMVTGTGLLRENLLNIVMLFPAGMLLPFVFDNRGKNQVVVRFVVCIFISGCIEGLQLILCRGLFEFDDMIHNSLDVWRCDRGGMPREEIHQVRGETRGPPCKFCHFCLVLSKLRKGIDFITGFAIIIL